MYWTWNTDSDTLRVAVAFAFFAEFSLVATCTELLVRLATNRPVSAAFVLSSLFLWEVVPGGVYLLPLTPFFPPAAVPILLTIFLAFRAKRLIGQGRILPGVITFLVPVTFVTALCFYRPWSPGSTLWPVVGAIHSALLLMALCIALFYIGHYRRGRYREA